jgi:competence protein ComEA
MKNSIRGFKCLLAAVIALTFAVPAMAAVDINKADAVTIAKELKGVGPAKAKAIVEYRTKNGSFKSVDDLLKVKGVGEHLLQQNRGNIQLGGTGEAKKAG